jgi:HPt (histidine-containing phosphotransfer) domain-containing protein
MPLTVFGQPLFGANDNNAASGANSSSGSGRGNRVQNQHSQECGEVEEDPPPYESLVPQQRSNNAAENGKPHVINPIYKRKTVMLTVVCMCALLILGIIGFSLNLSRSEHIKSEVNHIKHNHIPSLRQETIDLGSRADTMEDMIKQLLVDQEKLRQEIKRLRGEQEKADELRKFTEIYPDLKVLYNNSALTPSSTISMIPVLISSLISFLFLSQ